MQTVAAKKSARKASDVVTVRPGAALPAVNTVASYVTGDMTELALALHVAMLDNPEACARYAAIYGEEWKGFDVACMTLDEEIEAAFSLAFEIASL